MKEEFYTLKGYQQQKGIKETEAMEDYLEMIYRKSIDHDKIHVKDLSVSLHVKPSSTSKMLRRLQEEDLIIFPKYGTVTLNEKGKEFGKYLLDRHNLLTTFFKKINGDDYQLEQVEKLEHFVDKITIQNIEKAIKKEPKFFL